MSVRTTVFLNIHCVLAAAWRRRYVIVIPLFLLPILALFIGATASKRYVSHTTVLIQETTKLNPFLSDFSVSTQLKERMAALDALLHSRHMLTSVANDLGLTSGDIDVENSVVIDSLSNALSVRLIGSDMIKLTYKNHQPGNMAKVLTVVSEYFLQNLLAPERSSVNGSEEFLQSQLEMQEASLKHAEKNLAEFKSVNSARLPNQYSFDVEQLRDAESQYAQKLIELAGAQAQAESLRTQVLKTNPMLASVEESLIQKSSQLTLLKTKYTNRHSDVVALQREIERLQSERINLVNAAAELTEDELSALWSLASTLNGNDSGNQTRPLLVSQMEAIELAKSNQMRLVNEVDQLDELIKKLSIKLESFAGIEQQLKNLQRDISTKQDLYNDFLKRYELSKVTGALGRYEETDRVKIIDQPFEPYQPLNPALIVFGIAGTVGGLLLGMGLALIMEISDTTVVRRDSIEELLDIPVLTRLPYIAPLAMLPSSTLTKTSANQI